MFRLSFSISLFLTLSMMASAAIMGEFQKPLEYAKSLLLTKSPEQKTIWISKDIQPDIKKILGHKYSSLRVRYWTQQSKSAWVLEEIGKEKPITVGFCIESEKILDTKILAYRETRGYEVKAPFFTEQFKNKTLTEENHLSGSVDGISGATLSVRAVKKLATMALYLDKYINSKPKSP